MSSQPDSKQSSEQQMKTQEHMKQFLLEQQSKSQQNSLEHIQQLNKLFPSSQTKTDVQQYTLQQQLSLSGNIQSQQQQLQLQQELYQKQKDQQQQTKEQLFATSALQQQQQQQQLQRRPANLPIQLEFRFPSLNRFLRLNVSLNSRMRDLRPMFEELLKTSFFGKEIVYQIISSNNPMSSINHYLLLSEIKFPDIPPGTMQKINVSFNELGA